LIDQHKKKLKNFKARFPAKKYAITDDLVWDKDLYDKAIAQWREVKNYRTKNVVPDFKKLKAPYVAITKYYNDVTNPIITEFSAIEKPISDFVDRLEELKKAEDEKEKIALENRTNERVAKLTEEGAAFDGEFYSAGSAKYNVPEISLGIVDIETMTDPIFENVLEQVKQKAAIVSEAEQKQKEADQVAAEQKKKEAEAAAQKLIDDQAKLDKEKAEIAEQRISMRSEFLESIGMELTADKSSYQYKNVNIKVSNLGEWDKETWDRMLSGVKEEVAAIKKAAKEADEKAAAEKAKSDLRAARLKEIVLLGYTPLDANFNFTYRNTHIPLTKDIDAPESDWPIILLALESQINTIDERVQKHEERLAMLQPYLSFSPVIC